MPAIYAHFDKKIDLFTYIVPLCKFRYKLRYCGIFCFAPMFFRLQGDAMLKEHMLERRSVCIIARMIYYMWVLQILTIRTFSRLQILRALSS